MADISKIKLPDETEVNLKDAQAFANIENDGQGGSSYTITRRDGTTKQVTIPNVTTTDPGLMTASDKTKIDTIEQGAEVNQQAFSKIRVTKGSAHTDLDADTKTDTLELIEGNNITLTPSAVSDAVTIHAKDTVYTLAQDTTDGHIIILTNNDESSTDHVQTITIPDNNTTYTVSLNESTNEIVLTDSLGNTMTAKPSNASTSLDGFMSKNDKSKLDGIASGAEVNQNAFSNVVVDDVTIAADSKTDTLTLIAGTNISITPNATNDSITISSSYTNTTYELTQDATDGHKFTLSGSNGYTKTITIPDNNTTYTLSVGTGTDANQIVFTPSSGSATKITVPYATKALQDADGDAIKDTYAASFSIVDHTITLKNKSGVSLGTVTVPDNNTTYTFAEGTTNKAFSVTPSGGSAQTVPIHGLGSASEKNFTTSVTSGSADLVTSGAVASAISTAIDNLPEPMIFKGTLGTNGTITSLPTASSSNEGWTYKVITAGTYASQAAKVGDMFVSAKIGSAYQWVYVPSGDDVEDTWRNIKVNGTEKLGTGISSGAVDFVDGDFINITYANNKITVSHADTSSQASVSNSGRTYIQSVTLDGAGHVTNLTSATETVVNTDRYVNSASFSDDTTASSSSPVKMTLTRAGSDTATVTANIPKVSASSAGVAPKGTTVSSQSQSTKFLREDGTWSAPSYTVNTDTKVTSVGNHYSPSADSSAQLSALASGGTAAWSIDVVQGVQLQRDAKGHVVGVTVTSGKIPGNPNTNYYHKTGSWNGLTYTAGKVGSPDDLAFTIPTGTSATTVAVGNHTHKYAGSSSAGGAATSANKLNTDAGTKITPVYFSGGVPVATDGVSIPFIVGTGSTAGTWLGSLASITEYYDGLLILYKPSVAGASTTTLNINSLGAKTVYMNNTTKLTTHFPANQPILLVYSASTNSGCWVALDCYDSGNTNTQIRVYRQTTGYNADYPIIVSRTQTIGTAGTNDSYSGVYGVVHDTTQQPTVNPSTGEVKAKKLTGDITGNALTKSQVTTALGYTPPTTDTNYYHTTGSWSGLTYTATANGGAGALAFTIPTGTSATTVALGNHTHNYAGSSSAGGAATSLANFAVSTTTGLAVENTTNIHGYVSGLTKADWNYQQTDGAIYAQFYSASWKHQIFGDYRTGHMSVRGKNNGIWQNWLRVWDEGNLTSKAAASGGTDVSLVTTGEKATWNSKTSNTGTVTSITLKATSPIAIDSTSAITTSGTRTLSHANSGVTAGTYQSVTVNATGHVTAGSALTKAQVTTALGYTPPTTDTNTTYTIGTSGNNITLTPSSGSAQSITAPYATKAGSATDSTKLPLAGGTMTGQIMTSFKFAVAMGSRQSDATTIPDLCNDLRYSSGCCGSVSIGTAYTLNSITVAKGWYNYLWVPHRSGGNSGAASGDNCDYGSLYLSGMTLSGCYMIRYASAAIAELRNLYADNNTTYGLGTSGNNITIVAGGTTTSITAPYATSAGSATKLSNTAKIGDTNQPVYFTANGVPAAISYTIAKSVPSDAVFTDTNTKVTSVGNHYAPSADSSAQLSASASGGTAAWSIDVVQGVQLQRDAKGHVTGVTVTSGKIPANPNTDTKVTVTNTNPTSGTWYYPVWYTGTSGTGGVNANDGFRHYSLQGTTSAAGRTILQLGNSTASGTAGNKYGEIRIYAQKAGYSSIIYTSNATTNTTLTIPEVSGTIINTGNYTDYTVKKDGTGASGSWGISVTGSSASCTGNAATASVASKITATTTNPSSATTYAIPFVAGDGNQAILGNNGIRFYTKEGTTGAVGWGELVLGNNTSTGTAGNKSGWLKLFSEKNGQAELTYTAAATGNTTHYLPTTGGTLLNTGTTSFTQTLTSGTKVGEIKINGTSTDIFAPGGMTNVIYGTASTSKSITITSKNALVIVTSQIDKTGAAIGLIVNNSLNCAQLAGPTGSSTPTISYSTSVNKTVTMRGIGTNTFAYIIFEF